MHQPWSETGLQLGSGMVWPGTKAAGQHDDTGAGAQANLAVDNEFLHCFDELQHLYNHQQIEDPVMHLSQDWLGYLGPLDGSYDQYNGQQTFY